MKQITFAEFVSEMHEVVREARETCAVDAKGRNVELYFGDMLHRLEDALDLVNERFARNPRDRGADELLDAIQHARDNEERLYGETRAQLVAVTAARDEACDLAARANKAAGYSETFAALIAELRAVGKSPAANVTDVLQARLIAVTAARDEACDKLEALAGKGSWGDLARQLRTIGKETP